MEYSGATEETLGLYTVPDVSCAILVVGIGPLVVAHMHPSARGIVLVQPWIALFLALIIRVEIKDRGGRVASKEGREERNWAARF